MRSGAIFCDGKKAKVKVGRTKEGVFCRTLCHRLHPHLPQRPVLRQHQSSLPPLITFIMAQNQREAWERVQTMLQRRKPGFGGGFPGGGGRGFGLAGSLILLGVGSWVASNSLFNGMLDVNQSVESVINELSSGRWSPRHQILPPKRCSERDLCRRYDLSLDDEMRYI